MIFENKHIECVANQISKVSSQFTVDENDIVTNISKKLYISKDRYLPRRGTLEQFEKDINNIPFYFHYITDKNLLGINADRQTEKSVIPIKLGLKLSSDNYYVYDITKEVYEYRNGLYPLMIAINNKYVTYSVVSLDFNKKVK